MPAPGDPDEPRAYLKLQDHGLTGATLHTRHSDLWRERCLTQRAKDLLITDETLPAPMSPHYALPGHLTCVSPGVWKTRAEASLPGGGKEAAVGSTWGALEVRCARPQGSQWEAEGSLTHNLTPLWAGRLVKVGLQSPREAARRLSNLRHEDTCADLVLRAPAGPLGCCCGHSSCPGLVPSLTSVPGTSYHSWGVQEGT